LEQGCQIFLGTDQTRIQYRKSTTNYVYQ
jgi:hypothetical protein